jgi:hypothetical protein
MQIIVPCVVEIPDDAADLNVLEALVQDAGRRAMRQALDRAWQALQAREPACPRCLSGATVADGTRPYRVATVFGDVTLTRLRRRCRGCGAVYQPQDALLHAAGPGRATAGLVAAALLAGASWPFAVAADVLGRLSGAQVSAEWIRQTSIAQGQALGIQAAAEAEALITGQSLLALDAGGELAAQLLLALDGGWLASHDTAGGMEAKVAVIATGREQIGRTRWRLRGRRYVGRVQDAAQFGPQVFQAATAVGLGPDTQVAVLGDGAAWITSLTAACFPGAERRLDLWHLLRRATEAVRAEPLDEATAQRVRTELTALLRRGAVAEAETLVQQALHSQVGQAFGGYLANQREWIVDADALQAAGEVVGSGAVEKGVDLVINRRCKGRRGMRWWRANADAIVVLRTRILNGEPLAA